MRISAGAGVSWVLLLSWACTENTKQSGQDTATSDALVDTTPQETLPDTTPQATTGEVAGYVLLDDQEEQAACLHAIELSWFNRALPLLQRGGYVLGRDMPGARQLLKVAAYTYVAGSLASLLNLAAWLRNLR